MTDGYGVITYCLVTALMVWIMKGDSEQRRESGRWNNEKKMVYWSWKKRDDIDKVTFLENEKEIRVGDTKVIVRFELGLGFSY